MNILIVGNGFDLAHNLKTGYNDFLKTIASYANNKRMLVYEEETDLMKFCISEDEHIHEVYKSDIFKYMFSRLDANNGWIDFENELRDIVDGVCELPQYLIENRTVHKRNKLVIHYKLAPQWTQNVSPFMYAYIQRHIQARDQFEKNIAMSEISQTISNQIRRFIELFGKYLCWVDDKQVPNVEILDLFFGLHVDRFLSFNYTSTGPMMYGNIWNLEPENICYVHGEVQDNANNHIVMGIGSDFYDANKHSNFLPFFKFYQCYKYKTNQLYLKWLHENPLKHYYSNPGYHIDCSDDEKYKIYIYGHSLDPTDKNILLSFFDYCPENREVVIYIYYLDDSKLLTMERNLVKILGREKFESYLRGENPKIQFRLVPKCNSKD